MSIAPEETRLPFATRASRLTGSEIDSSTSLLQKQTHDVVRLAMGSPAAEAIPADQLSELAAELFPGNPDAFDYGPTEGESGLLDQLEPFTGDDRERMLVTGGGMQGLDLVCKLFVDPGDLVVVEAPTYTNGSATIASYEGDLLEVPVDDDGMIVDSLIEQVKRAGRLPKLIYSIPTFQNPSGKSMSLERRIELLRCAEEWGAVVLEDDPYGHLSFIGDPPPSLVELSGRAPWVIGVHTFSKIVAPGLRVGWLRADPSIIERMINAKQCMDTCSNVPAQVLVTEFMVRGMMESHLERLTPIYRERKDSMLAALEEAFGGTGTEWTDPGGGFFTWLTLPDFVDARDLFPTALANGVAYVPGDAFATTTPFGSSLRLCFASNTTERAAEGIRRLKLSIEQKYEV
ncbi:MAG: PLP-dependent aminotransferase family protein [Solirubrobacterales bacterium]|nr:PLP-dependent aminotransferase family protein [Solirubrobacterales bacterium]